MTDKHTATWNWLLTCPYIGDMFFNAGRVENGNFMLIPSESTAAEYTDGSQLRRYECALTYYAGYSQNPNDTANIDVVLDIDAVAAWVEAQVEARNFPDFPENCTVMDITVYPNEGGWMAAQDETLTKLMLQFTIEYLRG